MEGAGCALVTDSRRLWHESEFTRLKKAFFRLFEVGHSILVGCPISLLAQGPELAFL